MARADGDKRPIGVIRAEVAADLILRPWDTPVRRSPPGSSSTHRSPPSDRPIPARLSPRRRSPARSSPPRSAASCSSSSTCWVSAPHRRAGASRSRSATRSPAGSSPSPPATNCAAAQDRVGAGAAGAVRTDATRRTTVRDCDPPAPTNAYRTDRAPASLRPSARPPLPHARLPARTRSLRHRPWHRARRRRPDRLLEPLLPLPQTPPDQDLRPRLALRAARRRTADRPHAQRRLPDHPTARLVVGTRTRSTLARRGSATGPAHLLRDARRVPDERCLTGRGEERESCAAMPPGRRQHSRGVVACTPVPPPFEATRRPWTTGSPTSATR